MADRKKLLLIMNPKSGTMLAPKHLSEIISGFSGADFMTEVLMTTAGGDARDFAVQYGGSVDTVVVSGGDGTLNEVIDGLISGGWSTPLGYIPAGSTNDFANSVGLPKGIHECVDTIIRGTAKPVDIGSFNGRFFSYVASFGAFTSVTYSVPQNLKNIFGHAAYVMSGVNELANLKPIHARVTADKGTPGERVLEGDYLIGAVCNSRSIGGILHLDKLDVDMNDGLMEIMMVKMPRDLIALSDIAASMLSGSFKSHQIETLSAACTGHWTVNTKRAPPCAR